MIIQDYKEGTVKISSTKMRIIVILCLALIAVVVIVLLSLGPGRRNDSVIPQLQGPFSLRSFGSPGQGGPTASIDPCTLLLKGELEAELGRSLNTAQSGYVENPLGERYCRFPDPQASDEYPFSISIVFNSSIAQVLLNDGYNVLRMFEGRKISPELIQPIDDLGDEAFWGGSGSELWNGLHILARDVYLIVNVHSGDVETDYRVARNMAVAVLERLFMP